MIGSRGLPLIYAGIERHVAEIGSRLADRGHEVTVFGRRPFSVGEEHRGMRASACPVDSDKESRDRLEHPAADVRALFERFDVVHYHGIGPSLFSWITAAGGSTTVAHYPCGRCRRQLRNGYPWRPRCAELRPLGERTAVVRTHAAIAVSRIMAAELEAKYGRPVVYIPNGAGCTEAPPFRRGESARTRERKTYPRRRKVHRRARVPYADRGLQGYSDGTAGS